MSDEVLSLLIHGPSKAGKSTVSFTGPFPMLCMDAEGSTKFIRTKGFRSTEPVRKVYWNPLAGPPPRHDGTWEVCVVKVPDWQTVKMTYEHLKVSPHDFASLSLDSITEIQRKCKRKIKAQGQFQIQDWGTLLDDMDLIIRGFRDLLLLDNTLRVATFVCETEKPQNTGKWQPAMQGSIARSLPYWVDICGYFFQEIDPTAGTVQAKMLISNHPQYEAGERVQGRLGQIITEPNITDMLKTVYS